MPTPNKYCNLYGENKIKDDYTKINDGFATVESDVSGIIQSEVSRETAETQREVNETKRELRFSNTKHYGEYNANTTYHTNNVVSYQGSSFMLKENSDGSVMSSVGYAPPVYPATENDRWKLVGLKGDKGDAGAVPNITVGNTTTAAAGTQAKVTRRSGSPDTAPVFDFEIPKGLDGNGSGDMTKSDYDPDGDGSVAFADTLKGLTVPVSELNKLTANAKQFVALQWGMNKIQIPEMPISPKIEFTGFSITNLLGKDGNCEDLSKWQAAGTASLDAANKVFGNNAIKIVSNSGSAGAIFRTITLDPNKYYFCSGSGKCSTAAGIAVGTTAINSAGGGTVDFSSAASMARIGFKFKPTQSNMYITAFTYVQSGQQVTSYWDGIMINEISSDEYSTLTVSQLLAKYPYVDSYACLTNPSFENRRYNLVINGNGEEGIGYWILNSGVGSPKLSVNSDGGFKLVTTSDTWAKQVIPVKKNTNYYLSATASVGVVNIFYGDMISQCRSGPGTFNTGSYDKVTILLYMPATGTGTYKNIMVVEGTSAPTEYKTCEYQRFVVEGQFAEGDICTIENRDMSGVLNTKHSIMFGKDYEWVFNNDYTGFKRISCPQPLNVLIPVDVYSVSHIMIKPDGKVLEQGDTNSLGRADVFMIYGGYVYLNIADTDSGWLETLQPNANEVKAYMNGWYAIGNNGSRYTAWVKWGSANLRYGSVSIYPPKSATTLAVATSGTNTITVADSSIFGVGEIVSVVGADNGFTITAINGNVITLSGSPYSGAQIGNVVCRLDSATDLRNITYCINNISEAFEGHQLHYKLVNSEPITDINAPIKDTIWDLVKGDNYVYIDSGIVIDEIASPAQSGSPGDYYGINIYNVVAGWNNYGSFLRNKAEVIYLVYKNSLPDTWSIFNDNISGNGISRAYIPKASYDPNAVYTVDYQILKTLHAQSFGSLALSYNQSIVSTLESHSKSIEQKQQRSDVLDGLIDLSLYEVAGLSSISWGMFNASTMYVDVFIPFKVTKAAVPTIMVTNQLYITCLNASIQCILGSVFVSKNQCRLRYLVSNSSDIANIKANGLIATGATIIANCRGRV